MDQINIPLDTDDAYASILLRMPGAERSEIERLLYDTDALVAYLASTNDLTIAEARDTFEFAQTTIRVETDIDRLKAA